VRSILAVAAAVLLIAASGCAAASRPSDVPKPAEALPSDLPPNGVVPDSATAIRVAEAVLIPMVGADGIDRQRPLIAVLRDDVWHVAGSLPPGGAAV
jgi:hypothetical protein